jgi:hypothetical protein
MLKKTNSEMGIHLFIFFASYALMYWCRAWADDSQQAPGPEIEQEPCQIGDFGRFFAKSQINKIYAGFTLIDIYQ